MLFLVFLLFVPSCHVKRKLIENHVKTWAELPEWNILWQTNNSIRFSLTSKNQSWQINWSLSIIEKNGEKKYVRPAKLFMAFLFKLYLIFTVYVKKFTIWTPCTSKVSYLECVLFIVLFIPKRETQSGGKNSTKSWMTLPDAKYIPFICPAWYAAI